MEQEEPRPKWRPKCHREPRWRGNNLICLWRAAENKQRPVKLPLGRPCFTVCTEVWQLLRIKINHLLHGLQKRPDTIVYFFCGLIHFGHLDLVILCLLTLKIIRVPYFYKTVHPGCWAAVFTSKSCNISLWKNWWISLGFYRQGSYNPFLTAVCSVTLLTLLVL